MLIKPKRVISLMLTMFMIFSVIQINIAPAYSSDETDTTPPAFVADYPQAGSMQADGSRQLSFVIKAQEEAFYYYVVLPDGAAEPSKEQVAAGNDADGNPALKASKSNDKSTGISVATIIPLHDTNYDVYVVLKDDAGNLSEPAKVDVKSPPAANYLAAGFPQTGDVRPDGSKQVEVKIQLQNIESGKKGKVYWVLVPDGASPPSIEQVAAGTDGDGSAGFSSGSPEFSPGSEESFLVTGASGGTAYDLYMVAGNTNYANPLGSCTDVVKLDVTTPADIPNEKVCSIGSTEYETLAEAVNAAGSTATIKLLKSFTTIQSVVIDRKNITFDLNSFTLNITTTANEGLKVTEGTVALTGTGKLNVSGKLYGVWAGTNSNVTVTNATATDTGDSGIGVYAISGSKVTVLENASGAAHGVRAENVYTKVTVDGDVSNSAQIKGAVYSSGQAEVLVKGNVSSSMGYGVHSYGGKITVDSNVSGSHVGAMAEDTGAAILIKGDLSCYNNGAVIVSGNGSITVDGEIITSLNYVRIGSADITKTQGVTDPAKPGYLKYSDNSGSVTGAVWVKVNTANPDGTTWTQRSSATNKNLLDIAYNGIMFVSVGYTGTIQTSPDGISWTIRNSGTTESLWAVEYLNGKFIAVGEKGVILTSGDGTSWSSKTSNTSHVLYDLAFGNNKFVAVGGNPSGNAVVTSNDGATWTFVNSGHSIPFVTVTYGNGNFIALGQNGQVYKSTDGVQWARTYLPGGGTYPKDIIYADNRFIATANNGRVFISNDNGTSWTVKEKVNGIEHYINSAAYGGGNLVAVTQNGNILASFDKGNTWTQQISGFENQLDLYGIAAGSSNFVAVGQNGLTLQSSDFGTPGNPDADAVAAAKTALTWDTIKGANSTENNVTTDLISPLPTAGSSGTTISWSANPTGWINTTTGATTIPTSAQGDQPVTLTATIIKGSASDTKSFNLTIKAAPAEQTPDDAIALDLAALNWDTIKGTNSSASSITNSLNLVSSGANGTSISWSADPAGLINTGTGAVTRPTSSQGNKTVSLTAVISKAGGTSKTKSFNLTIAALSSGGSGGGGSYTPSAQTINAVVKAGTYKQDYPITIDKAGNSAVVSLDSGAFNTAFEKAEAGSNGVKTVNIAFPAIQGTNSYILRLPVSALSSENANRNISMSSNLGIITLPGNMLKGTGLAAGDNIEISISKADKSKLPESVRNIIGDRPVTELRLTKGSQTIAWNNPAAPVVVTIPYTPTKEELSNPEQITVWYIDGNGNVVSVPSGRYDSATGTVTFKTTHFSKYAVVYLTKTFDDLGNVSWAKKPIEVLASKGVLKGISEKNYDPQTNVTRADFLYYLVRALGLDAKVAGNFDDIKTDAYYYKEIAIAKNLGITSGTGNNKFNPDAGITRQDMMALTERALRMFKDLKNQGKASDLDKFTDKSLIAGYALNSVAALVKEGLIEGSNNRINPLGNTSRAEAAVFLYKIYNKY